MKRLLIAILIVAAVLTLSVAIPARAQGETCEAFAQPFTIPDAFPLDGEDWTFYPQANGAVSDIQNDGFVVSGSGGGGLNHGANAILILPAAATITHIEVSVTDALNDLAAVSVEVCYDEACSSPTPTMAIFENLTATPFSAEDTTTYNDVVAIRLGLVGQGGDPSSATMDNLVIDGTLDACPYRPVLTDDTITDVSLGVPSAGLEAWAILTNPGAKVFAVDDSIVASLTLDANGYSVGLLVNGADPILYTRLSAAFATVGDEIQGGCVLGYAGPSDPDDQVNTGRIGYVHNDNLADWHDYNESLSETPCNAEDSNCINVNADFNNDAEGWLSRDGFMGVGSNGDDETITLRQGAQAYQPGFTVALADTYYVTLAVKLAGVATTGEVTVWIGGAESVMAINVLNQEYAVLTTQALSPAYNGTSELRITNTSANDTPLAITFACLHTGDAQVQPDACYFEDPELLTDTFETEGGAAFEVSPLGAGRYSLPVGGVIRSPVSISAFVDADTDFHLAIQGAAPDGTTDVTASIVDSDTDDELQAIDNYEYTSLLWANLTRGFTLDSAESVVGDLYIENTGAQTVLISSLCLSSDVGFWPGYENPDYANNSLLPADCTACEFPDSLTDVVAWLNWIGCVLRYLIYCLLMTLVNNIWNTVLAIGQGLGLFGRWLGKAFMIVVDWAWRAAGRLLATLISSAIPILNAILAWILTLPFVRSLLDTAAIIGIWVEGVFTLIVNTLILFGRAIQFVGVLFSLFSTGWSAFFAALSASPEVTVVLPDCTDPETPFYDACLVFDVLNYVLAAVPAMGLLGAALVVKIGWNRMRKAFKGLEEIFSI